jgi:hypothetical protein
MHFRKQSFLTRNLRIAKLLGTPEMKSISSLSLAAFIMLTGCATPYGLHQVAGGYSDVRVQNDVFRVVFDGNGFIHKSQVDYYALVRAAELTVQSGRDYFRILGGDTDIRTINVFIPGQTFATSNTYGTGYGRATAYPIGRSVYASAYGAYNANTFTNVSSTPSYSTTIQRPIVTLDIQTLPRRIDPSFDARQVLQGAIERKLKFEAATLNALGRSST